MTYRCVTVSAAKDENVLDKIYQILNEEDGYFNTRFQLKFVGFETIAGTGFKINKMSNKVPSSGYFVTPYNGEYYMTINSLSFDEGCNALSIYIIY